MFVPDKAEEIDTIRILCGMVSRCICALAKYIQKSSKMFSLLLLWCSCEFWTLENATLAPGQILERFIDVETAAFETHLIVDGDVTFLHFEETNRDKIFTTNSEHKPVCCDYNDTSCKLFEASDLVVLIPTDAGKANIIPTKSSGIQSFVLANCLNTPVTVSGTIVVKNSLHYLDARLHAVQGLLSNTLKGMIFFIIIFACLFIQSKATFTKYHMIYIVSIITEILSVGLENAFLREWDSSDKQHTVILVLTGIFRAISHVTLFIVTYAGLHYPVEIDWLTSIINIIILSMIMIGDLFGYMDFQGRATGDWYLGHGSPPCILFLAIASPCVWVTVQGLRTRNDKTAFGEKRKFLVFFAVSFVSYVVISIVLMLSRLGSSLVDTRSVEWIPFTLENWFYILLVVANGWHWLYFNQQAWQAIDNMDNELGVETEEPESLVGTGRGVVPKGPREMPEFVLDNNDEE